jgi:sulfur carrier protein ThiS
MTIEKLFKQKMPHEESHDYLIRVNRQPVPKEYVLKENDRVTVTPTKIDGAAC